MEAMRTYEPGEGGGYQGFIGGWPVQHASISIEPKHISAVIVDPNLLGSECLQWCGQCVTFVGRGQLLLA